MEKWPEHEFKCPIVYTLSVVGGKWKWIILYKLSETNCLRYGELKRVLPPITHKMLSQQLKEMENEQLVYRQEYHQIPPKVEYSLTEKGRTIIPILNSMANWGRANRLEPKEGNK
jgi:DNA-binding HxlR family transcriptional regulator